ncbi:MAG: sirohydrochlorin chelatase [Actinomycetota bacterium]|nr:sirohydrochlorin chelatase [Actinomycetota bacterium]
MPEPVLVAVAHGSQDPRASATVAELMAVVAERATMRGIRPPDLRTAYLGHAPPSLPQVMSTIDAGRPVRVLPLLLTAAYHSKSDIPSLLTRVSREFPRLRISYGQTLGPHRALLRALERRLAEEDPGADRARTGVVLASAGSSDPEANATIARLAAQWQDRAGWFAVRPAYASAADPSPAAAVTGLLQAGAPRVVVATYLLAPGFFADRIRASSLAAGAAAVSPALGACVEVADVLLDRFAETGSRRLTAA